jgi:hypothetical protein
VFEELGNDFTLLAFDITDTAEMAFALAAKALQMPLKIVRDSYDQGRCAFEAKFLLVRPDRYVAWTANDMPSDPIAILAKAIARPSF